jgi:acetylornithine deacetylase/succinyl-diaminopimelate desuccinylase-like protein/uncharacterized protein YdeI (YjbR/CyaY-like superfamily)
VSAEGFPAEEVRRSADATATLLREAGLENVRLLEMTGQHPYAYADWLHAQGAPTLLVYGHHDVQPPGRPEKWVTPAFEPAERDGRLYGRGAVDDKGTFITHVAAVRAFLESTGRLPLNLKFLIEGEEEIGSPGLEAFLKRFGRILAADAAVLADTGNFDVGHPALTYQLRGICQVDVEVRCLKQPVHSGFWGGPVPDAVRILARLLADLEHPDGSLNVPGLYRSVARSGARQLRRIRALPFEESKFRRSAAMRPGTRFVGEKAYSVWERLWTRPSLTVIALEAHPIPGSSNQIVDSARARLSLRTVPDMDGRKAGELLVRKLTTKPPAGARVTARVTGASHWWTTDPEGPAFEAARRALEAGYGREAAMIGAGGSIGFVKPFSDALGGVPCLLMGVEDPASAIHSENESLHLGDFRKAIRAAVHLYYELSGAQVGRAAAKPSRSAGGPRSFPGPASFRAWLEKHGARATEIVVRCRKAKAGHRGITYRQALDEALCLGWIDGVRRSVDDVSFSVRFTPRKAKSAWSAVNVARARQLQAEGRLHPAGLSAFRARVKPQYSYESRPRALAPAYLARFRAHPRAWRFFQVQPPWYRRTCAFWVMSAKRPETRARRLDVLITSSELQRGVPPLKRPTATLGTPLALTRGSLGTRKGASR